MSNGRPRRCLLALLLGIVAASTACSSGYKKYECSVGPEALHGDPQLVWDCHRDIMRRAARDKKFTLLEFREAATFFERLTSIGADAQETPFGPVPTVELKHKLALWDEWYREHGTQLIWDGKRHLVRLGP